MKKADDKKWLAQINTLVDALKLVLECHDRDQLSLPLAIHKSVYSAVTAAVESRKRNRYSAWKMFIRTKEEISDLGLEFMDPDMSEISGTVYCDRCLIIQKKKMSRDKYSWYFDAAGTTHRFDTLAHAEQKLFSHALSAGYLS
jgi:hypothetical protein